jgi:GNAT superfamily N-acetyltransferase
VAAWIYNEFIKGIRAGVTYESVELAIASCHKTTLPVRLIALQDGQCVGTVSLVSDDLKGSGYTPWLAALYVDKPFRSQKIAEGLIERVKDIMAELGYDKLYLRTEHAAEYYRKRGWTYIETREDEFGLKPSVFGWKKI